MLGLDEPKKLSQIQFMEPVTSLNVINKNLACYKEEPIGVVNTQYNIQVMY